jgi:alpha-glucosidase
MRQTVLLVIWLVSLNSVSGQRAKNFALSSPDGRLSVKVNVGDIITWSVTQEAQTIIAASGISIRLSSGEILGKGSQVISSKTESVNETINAINYKKDKIENKFTQLTITCKGDYGIRFRAYNDGIAYRFFTKRK